MNLNEACYNVLIGTPHWIPTTIGLDQRDDFIKAVNEAVLNESETITFDGKKYNLKFVEGYEPESTGEEEFADIHDIDIEDEEELDEEDDKYKEFFNKALKKWNIDSPEDLKTDEEKKKFFDWIDKNYKAVNEKR